MKLDKILDVEECLPVLRCCKNAEWRYHSKLLEDITKAEESRFWPVEDVEGKFQSFPIKDPPNGLIVLRNKTSTQKILTKQNSLLLQVFPMLIEVVHAVAGAYEWLTMHATKSHCQ